MPKVHANGIDLAYEIHGDGKPLVLIAGLGYDRWMWHKMVPGLAEGAQVITFDNRGVGASDKPPGPYSAQMLADDTAGLLEALEIPRAAVMGHSMGGFIAQAMALQHPDKIDRLILSATNFGGLNHIPAAPEAMAVMTDLSVDPVERFRRGLVVSCAPGFAERNPQVIADWMARRAAHPVEPAAYQAQLAIGLSLLPAGACFEDRLKQVQAPVLLLFGEHDQVVPPGNAELLARVLPDSQVRILPGAGHFFPIETPQAAVEAVLSFLHK